jgi:predicted metalloprotease with PDZ domain
VKINCPLSRLPLLIFSLLCFLCFASPSFAAPPHHISYTVTVADTANKRYRVTARAEGVTEATISFALPAWSPGWYVLTNAYKNIENVTATDGDGKPLLVTHPDKLTYTVTGGGRGDVILSYDLRAIDRDPDAVGPGATGGRDYGFFAPYLDESNGFVPGPASLTYVVGGKSVPCSVTYKVPEGWKIASANDPGADNATFTAKDYDSLADSPADLGKFDRYDRTIAGVPISVVIVGASGRSHRKFTEACWKIAEAGIRVIGGGKSPFPRYIFHFRAPEVTVGIAGLEHLNSTVITLPLSAIRTADPDSLSVIAHEFVHAWNVKRIRPDKLGPFDYTREVRVRDLWWLEGVTDYYAPRILLEAGLVGQNYWRSYMAYTIGLVQNNPSRKRVTLETASLKAWEGRSEGFDGLSYYEKGLVVGLLLDIEMRRVSKNRVGTDDLMKTLFSETDKRGQGYPEGEIERTASRLAGSDLTAFFDKTLRSTTELPLKEILESAGLNLIFAALSIPDFGIDVNTLTPTAEGIRIGSLIKNGPAERSGLKEGDILLAVNGKNIRDIDGTIFGDVSQDQDIALSIRRDNVTRSITLTVGEKKETAYELRLIAEATPLQKAIRTSLIGRAISDSAGTPVGAFQSP